MTAEFGQAGAQALRAHGHLILRDLHLPGMNGVPFSSALQTDPKTADLPVIVLSGDATQRHARELFASGARAYLTKRLDIPDFLAVVHQHPPAKVA